MKKIATILSLLLSLGAFAAPAPLPDQGGQSINLLKNNQFSQGKTGLTASAPSTYTLVSDSSAIVGTSGKFLPTTSGQTLTSDTYTVPPGLVGAPCLLSIPYRSSESTNLINAQILDGSNAGVSPVVPFTRNSGPAAPLQLTAVCPSSIKFRFTSTGSASGLVFDNLLLGADNRISQVSQAAMYGTAVFPSTATCSWVVTSSTPSDPAAIAGCPFPTVTGALAASATKTPTIEAPNAPAGTYEVTFVPGHVSQRAGSNCHFYVVDENNVPFFDQDHASGSANNFLSSAMHGVFSYSSAGSHTFKARMSSSDNTSVCTLENDGVSGGFIVKYFPGPSQTITKNSGQAASWSGGWNASQYWQNTGVNPPADMSQTSAGTFTQYQNRNFGSVTPMAGDLPGVNVVPPALGLYSVCAKGKGANNSVPTYAALFQLVDQSGNVIAEDDSYEDFSHPSGVTLCGIVNFQSFSGQYVKVLAASDGGSISRLGGGTSRSLQFTFEQLDAGKAAVAYPGVVSSSSANQQKIEWANLDPSAVVTASSSAWIGGGSVTATGIHSYTISGFSARPYCMCTVPTGAATLCSMETVPTTSNVTTHTRQVEAAADNDVSVDIVCIGPK